jgi:hypothetical protein
MYLFAKVLHECPECGSHYVRPSRRKGFVEVVVLRFLLLWPYRCNNCDVRFLDFTSSQRNPTEQKKRDD